MNPSNYPYGFSLPDYAPPNTPSCEFTKLPRQPTCRIYCQAAPDLSVTIREGVVVLAPADSNDYYQHWIKDMRYSTVSSSDAFPHFSLINRMTGQALKANAAENQPVTLIPYNLNNIDETAKWSQGASTPFHAIRISRAITFNMTTARADNIIDGTRIIVQQWADKPIQYWKIVPYNANVPI